MMVALLVQKWNMKMQTKPTKGVKGFIMHGMDYDRNRFYFFRVYDENHNFIDYDIEHYDLEVEILEDALFYDNGEKQWIDYKDE